MTIPIRNLYYLFCYAWERFPEGGSTEVGIDECPDVPNLFARVLINGLNRIIRRGLDRGYLPEQEETQSPCGRILIERSLKEQTLSRGKVYCDADELQIDVLHNQILKATATTLAVGENVAPDLRHQLNVLGKKLHGVSDIRLTSTAFRRVQLFRNNAHYGMLIRLCELVFQSKVPDESGATSKFSDILRDEVKMSRIFEDFLRNFYYYEQTTYRVAREDMRWRANVLPGSDRSLIPLMRTDITLRSPRRTMVLDAKFYTEPFPLSAGTPKVRSAHLYQLYSYLRHAGNLGALTRVDGALVYASTGEQQRHDYEIDGHTVSIVAIDLRRSWQEIRETILEVVTYGELRSGGESLQ